MKTILEEDLVEILNKNIPKEGIDISLLDCNLSLSPEERLKQHQRSLNIVREFQQAGRRYYERLREPPQNTPQS